MTRATPPVRAGRPWRCPLTRSSRTGCSGSGGNNDSWPPWRSLCDDATLVVRDASGRYWAHPWPTWSRFYTLDGVVHAVNGVSFELLPERLRERHRAHRRRYNDEPAIRSMGQGLELPALRRNGAAGRDQRRRENGKMHPYVIIHIVFSLIELIAVH